VRVIDMACAEETTAEERVEVTAYDGGAGPPR
jgi:hypothetical protein